MSQNEQMSVMEYDAFVNMVNSMTEEQKQTTARLLSDDLLWQELSARYYEKKQTLENILKAAKA